MTVEDFMKNNVNDDIDNVHNRISSISHKIIDISSQLRDKAKVLTQEERAEDKWMYDSLISFIEWELIMLARKIEDNVNKVKIDVK